MQESLSSISQLGKGYSPIGSYNKLIGSSLGNTNLEQANESLGKFQSLLDEEMNNIKVSDANSFNLGISIEDVVRQNFDDIFGESKKVETSSSIVDNMAKGFGGALKDNVNSLNNAQLASEHAVETLASGGDISVHEVMIASEKAGLSMQMAMQIRNRMMSAYNELYQMRF